VVSRISFFAIFSFTRLVGPDNPVGRNPGAEIIRHGITQTANTITVCLVRMPDLNFETKSERNQSNRRYWLKKGMASSDATRYLVETGPGVGQADTSETHGALVTVLQKSDG
jgi:hypothetical protein